LTVDGRRGIAILLAVNRQPSTVNEQLSEVAVEEDAKKWIYYAIPVAVVIAIGAALYYGRQREPEPATPTATAPPASTTDAPGIQHPIEDVGGQSAETLPSLADSDVPVRQSLADTVRGIEQFLVPNDIVRHIVVTVDNLPRKKTAIQMWPLKPTAGELQVSGTDNAVLSDANFERYAPLVALADKSDAKQLGALYKRYYPLFQEAYVNLGYPDGYFNDRLVEVIDHLLATPDLQEPPKLTRPSVFYEFADPTLEQLSAGQKTLLRMGPQHAGTIKAKLRELRQEITKK
jgi:hypothetical protein